MSIGVGGRSGGIRVWGRTSNDFWGRLWCKDTSLREGLFLFLDLVVTFPLASLLSLVGTGHSVLTYTSRAMSRTVLLRELCIKTYLIT